MFVSVYVGVFCVGRFVIQSVPRIKASYHKGARTSKNIKTQATGIEQILNPQNH